MRPRFVRFLLVIALAAGSAGCVRKSGEPRADEGMIAEGVLYSVEYELGDGRTGGFTRLDLAEMVPGGNGSWNIDAYGRLTREYLVITYPQKQGLGPRVIPAHRLVDVQFGDGGITRVDKDRSGHKGAVTSALGPGR